MIAIPVDTAAADTRSSKLFGNVSGFALFNAADDAFRFVNNDNKGDGVATAKGLADLSVDTVIYSFLGNGPFGVFEKEGINVYYIGKEPMALPEIVKGITEQRFVKVDASNADTYLDPGTATGNCACGCTHD